MGCINGTSTFVRKAVDWEVVPEVGDKLGRWLKEGCRVGNRQRKSNMRGNVGKVCRKGQWR